MKHLITTSDWITTLASLVTEWATESGECRGAHKSEEVAYVSNSAIEVVLHRD